MGTCPAETPSRRGGAGRSSPCPRRRAAPAARAPPRPRGRCAPPPTPARRDVRGRAGRECSCSLGLDSLRKEVELLETVDDEGGRFGRRQIGGLEAQLRVERLLVRRRDAGEVVDLTGEGGGVEALRVAPGALLERGRDVDLDERRVLLDEPARVPPHLLVRRDRRDDHDRAGARQPRRDPADARDVRVPVLLREAETLREVRTDDVAVEVVDNEAAPLELRLDDVRDRGLACAGQAGEPEDEPGHVWIPHSVLSVPAQRPSRPLPGRVECVSPIDSYPWSCSSLYGRPRSRMYAQQSSSDQSASGFA